MTRAPGSRSRFLIVSAAAAALVIIIVGAVIGTMSISHALRGGAPGGVTVEDLVSGQDELGEMKDVTSTYCGDQIPCVEAWSTDLGTYIRFGSQADADHWAMVFGADGAQWERFVLDARGTSPDPRTADDRRAGAPPVRRHLSHSPP